RSCPAGRRRRPRPPRPWPAARGACAHRWLRQPELGGRLPRGDPNRRHPCSSQPAPPAERGLRPLHRRFPGASRRGRREHRGEAEACGGSKRPSAAPTARRSDQTRRRCCKCQHAARRHGLLALQLWFDWQAEGGRPPPARHPLHMRHLRRASAGDHGKGHHLLDHRPLPRVWIRQQPHVSLLGRGIDRPPRRTAHARDGAGSTEMLHIYCSNRLDDVRPGSSGKPVPGYELKILDDQGSPVEKGEAGDLYVKGDSALALYWAQHEKSKRSILGDWFFTGDRYRIDGDGFYWYEGRSDDMIKVSGLWVSPIEIESALLEHPAVAESAVVGISIDGFTKIKAFVIAKPDAPGTEALVIELQDHCKSRLQRYQYPHLIEFVSDLPKT